MKTAYNRIGLFAVGWSFIMMCVPALVHAFYGDISWRFSDCEIQTRIAHLAFSFGFILLAWALMGSKLFVWLSLPLTVFAQLEAFNIVVLKTPSSVGTIGSMLDTNWRESFELASSYMPFVAVSIIVLALHAIVVLISRRHFQQTTFRSRRLMLVSALCLMVPEFILIKTRPWPRELRVTFLVYDVQDTFPFGTLLKLGSLFQDKYRMASRHMFTHSFDWKTYRSMSYGASETYVIVIGESSRSGNWSLYGYDKPTTPRLQAYSDLIAFNDVTSGTAETTESVPMYLTMATPEHVSRFDSTSSVISCFRKMGFKSWWLSMQGRYGVWDTKPAMIGKESDEHLFLNVLSDDEALHDGLLLSHFDKALRDTAKRKLIILHTSGSHFKYTRRYPVEFAKFPVVNEKAYEIGSYNNSILYTDWFLDQVLSRLRKTPGVRSLAYISDHGEALGENRRVSHNNTEPPRAEFEIPFFVWLSDELKQLRPELATQLGNHVDVKASASDFLPTFLDITDMRTPLLDSTRSLGNKYYRPRVRMVRLPQGNLVDVDQLTGSGMSQGK